MPALLCLRCSCGEEFSTDVAGRDWVEVRTEAQSAGWHCNDGTWRCQETYDQWLKGDVDRLRKKQQRKKKPA